MPGEQIRVRETKEVDGVDLVYQDLVTAADKVALAQSYSLSGKKSVEGANLIFACKASGSAVLDKFFGVCSTMDGAADAISGWRW